MIVGFSSHGRGKAAGPIAYLMDRVRGGVEREPPPTVLRGDPELVAALIDGSRFAHRYTSGVLSFAPGEEISIGLQQEIMDRFEATAFAGLDRDQYAILWVRHEHAGHYELNFLVPRVELSTGKSLNIAPPGSASRVLFDAFRTAVNLEHDLADPDDPARVREVRVPAYIAKLRAADLRAGRDAAEDPRETIAAAIGNEVAAGRIADRDGVLTFLRDAGFQISREGKDYVSVRDAETNDKYRLKGPYFHAGFQREQLTDEIAKREIEFGKPAHERLAECREHLELLTAKRQAYNEVRYQGPSSTVRSNIEGILLLSLEAGNEREGLETPGLFYDGAARDRSRMRNDRHCLDQSDIRSDGETPTPTIDHDGAPTPRRLRGDVEREWALAGNPEAGTRQRLGRLSESELLLSSGKETLTDDGAGASFAHRLRALGARLLETGERAARSLGGFTAGIRRFFGGHDDAAREHDEAVRGLDGARERFERAVRSLSESLHRVAGSAIAARSFDRAEDADLQLEVER